MSGPESAHSRIRCASTSIVAIAGAVVSLALGACASQPSLDREALLDPASCESCHPDQVREWSGSMHAYASDDPMFIALNDLLQEQTGGAAAGFCIGCHAPIAVREGATVDGTDIDSVPRYLRGVTCYFCHAVDAVEDDHNGALHLADDGVIRGPIADPVYTEAHESRYSALHDGRALESSQLCGACHDVVTPGGLHLEKTFAEWRDSVFAKPGPAALSCNRCHMPGSDRPAAMVAGAPERRVHEHAVPGIDVALHDWPETAAQRTLIARDLQPSILGKLCVSPGGGGVDVEVTLDNLLAGHSFPSGVTHARRTWVELTARTAGDVVYQSGALRSDEPAAESMDPDLWLLRTHLYDKDDDPTLLPWLATRVESQLLPAAVTNDPSQPGYYHSRSHSYHVDVVPDEIDMRVHVRPVGLEIGAVLVDLGAIDPSVVAAVPTFTLTPTEITWRTEDGYGCVSGGNR